jgi:hypothetical protein
MKLLLELHTEPEDQGGKYLHETLESELSNPDVSSCLLLGDSQFEIDAIHIVNEPVSIRP